MRGLLRTLLRTPPKRYQVKGVYFLERCQGRAILGDDMGLGKTYQVIAWAALHPEVRPILIVCPASVKYGWQDQFWTHAGIRAEVLSGKQPYSPTGDIWILNYDVLQGWEHLFQQRQWKPKLLVLDEAHRVKNRSAKRTGVCRRLSRRCEYVMALTGTPIRNRPIDLWPVLNMVAPSQFPSVVQYAFAYCDPKPGWRGRGWDYSGACNLDELHQTIKAVMIRRTKQQVLPELPPKTRTFLPVDLSNQAEYEEAQEDFVGWFQKQAGTAAGLRAAKALALVRLNALIQLVGQGKKQVAVSWINDWHEQHPKGKLVVFCTHKQVLGHLREHYSRNGEVALIDGGVSLPRRREAELQFQQDPSCWLFLGNMTAAGEGLNLQAAATVLFVELGWVPAQHDQAEDRVLRIGQTASHVDVYYLVGNATVEEHIITTLKRKRRIINHAIDGGVKEDVRTIVLRGLLEKP